MCVGPEVEIWESSASGLSVESLAIRGSDPAFKGQAEEEPAD